MKRIIKRKEGDLIPENAIFVASFSEKVLVGYEQVVEDRTNVFNFWFGGVERIYNRPVTKNITYLLYEVDEPEQQK